MTTETDEPRLSVSEVTRGIILERLSGIWAGKLDEADFLGRIWNLNELPSSDNRFTNASQDIWQHRVNNPTDWTDDWVYTDPRFNVRWAPDEVFFRFIQESLHPGVRDEAEAAHLVADFNIELGTDGWELYAVRQVSGRPVYGAKRLAEMPAIADEVQAHDQATVEETPGTYRGRPLPASFELLVAKQHLDNAREAIERYRTSEPDPDQFSILMLEALLVEVDTLGDYIDGMVVTQTIPMEAEHSLLRLQWVATWVFRLAAERGFDRLVELGQELMELLRTLGLG